MRERTRLADGLEGYRALESALDDAVTLYELGEAEEDEAAMDEAEADLEALRDRTERRRLESLLSGEADGNDC